MFTVGRGDHRPPPFVHQKKNKERKIEFSIYNSCKIKFLIARYTLKVNKINKIRDYD